MAEDPSKSLFTFQHWATNLPPPCSRMIILEELWKATVFNQIDTLLTAFTAAPSLNLTAEEKRVFGQLFREADSENIGVVTGEVAVKFFEKTRLEPRILGEVCSPVIQWLPAPWTTTQRVVLIHLFNSRYGRLRIKRIEDYSRRRDLA